MKMLLTIVMILFTSVVACATPTPTVSKLVWDKYTDQNGKGFYVYWRAQAQQFDNNSRTKITDVNRVDVLLSALSATQPASTLCYALTAYDSADNESNYSNEVCGFTGFSAPSGLKGQ